MQFHKIIVLMDGRTCTLRNGTAEDWPWILIFGIVNTGIGNHMLEILARFRSEGVVE